jgi:hypothetical protein
LSQGIGPIPCGFFFFSSKKARWHRIPVPRAAKTRTEERRRFPAIRLPITANPRVEERTRDSMVLVLIPNFPY